MVAPMAASIVSVFSSAFFSSSLATWTAASCLVISASRRFFSFCAKAMYDDRIFEPWRTQ